MKKHFPLLAAALMSAGLTASLPTRADDLLSLYREAVEADATWRAAQSGAAASRELKPQALAQLLPNVSFSGNQFKNDLERERPVGFGMAQDYKYDSNNYSVGLTQPLFRAGTFIAWQQSQALVQGAEADLLWAEQEVGSRVAAAYFEALLVEGNLEVTRAQRDAYLTQLDYAQKAFQTGSGTRTDIDEARSQLDLAVAQTIGLQYQLNYARDALRAIIDRPLTPLSRLNPNRLELVRPDPDRLEDWIRKAEEANPRLAAMRANVEAASLQVKKAMVGHLPTVDFVAQRVKSESSSDNLVDTKDDNKIYGLRFEMPIFSGGAMQSQVRQARAELDQSRERLEEMRRAIGLQVRKEFDSTAQGVSWVRAFEQAVKSAEQALVSTRKGFMAGTRTTLDILTAEQNLATARRDLHRGRCQYVLSRMQLLALTGGLSEAEIAKFNGWLEERTE
ncbi:MAG: TolC family outer membrane protein [Azoarcus sp.]|jgi:TolC family type I secretion outer membrane protein|nr:TolC family outer membrane protein [Azoarcus sp.]